jgi:hypothetical protein
MASRARDKRIRHEILDLFAELHDLPQEEWLARPERIKPEVWSYHLRRLEQEGCVLERRRDGRRVKVRPPTPESWDAWDEAIATANRERGYPTVTWERGEDLGKADEPVLIVTPGKDQKGPYFTAEVAGIAVKCWVAKAPDGRLVITELHLGGQRHYKGEPRKAGVVEITTKTLRALPLGALLNEAAPQVNPRHAVPCIDSPPRAKPGRAKLSDEFLEEVAAVYREALVRSPQRPYSYFARPDRDTHRAVWTASASTARRWVWQARKAGKLGPTTRGKAGEQPVDDQEGDDHGD